MLRKRYLAGIISRGNYRSSYASTFSWEAQYFWSIRSKTAQTYFGSQINWQPNHWNRRSIDNQITWILNQLTTKITWIANHLTTTFECWINWQHQSVESHISWQPNHMNLRWTDNQITWIPNQLTTKIIWISNQMTTKSFDSQLIRIWHQLTFEPIELHTPSSYRFLMVGNFRHRLVR